MAQRASRGVIAMGAAVLGAALTSCSSQDARLKAHAEKLQSLRATTTSISQAWAAHDISPTFARQALDETFQLLKQERASIAQTPLDLAVPAAAALVHDSDIIANQISTLARDVANADQQSARHRQRDLLASAPGRP